MMPSHRLNLLTGSTVLGLIASTIMATPALAEDQVVAQSTPSSIAATNTPATVEPSDPTVTDVELTPVELPAGYTTSNVVPKSTGDAQQHELRAAPLSAASQVPAGAARVELNSDVAVFGVVWDVSDSEPVRVEYRTLAEESWSGWEELEVEGTPEGVEAGNITQHGTEPAFVTGAAAVEVIAFTAEGEPTTDLEVNIIDPTGGGHVNNSLPMEEGTVPSEPESDVVPEQEAPVEPDASAESEVPTEPETPEQGDTPTTEQNPETVEISAAAGTAVNYANPGVASAANAGSFSSLTIKSRVSWGANENYRDKKPDPGTTYKGAIVHHTAGSNGYSRSEVPSIIQGVYYYHAVTKGWGDIGYHLVVDKYGGVWAGRWGAVQRAFVGAQAIGANYDTFGISVLGTFTSKAPPAVAQDATAKAIAWMFNKFNIDDPNGKMRILGVDNNARTIPTIAGHREVGSGTRAATACPGTPFQNRLPSIRNKVESYMWPPLSGNVKRHWGEDRYATAADTSKKSFPDGANTVYIANGMNFPDALAGGASAGIDDAPLLLTRHNKIPPQTTKELQRLKPTEIVVLGGSGVVNGSVATQLKKHGKVTRYGGDDRFETAADLALDRTPSASTVYIANGMNFPDALSGVPIAAKDKAPLLLTRGASIPAETKNALASISPDKIVILGGSGVVSSKVATDLGKYSSSKPTRRDGIDRYQTAAKTAQSKYKGTVDTVYVANGMDFPDALAGGPSARKADSPFLLVARDRIPKHTADALKKMDPNKIVILGGTGAVSRNNEHRLDRYVSE